MFAKAIPASQVLENLIEAVVPIDAIFKLPEPKFGDSLWDWLPAEIQEIIYNYADRDWRVRSKRAINLEIKESVRPWYANDYLISTNYMVEGGGPYPNYARRVFYNPGDVPTMTHVLRREYDLHDPRNVCFNDTRNRTPDMNTFTRIEQHPKQALFELPSSITQSMFAISFGARDLSYITFKKMGALTIKGEQHVESIVKTMCGPQEYKWAWQWANNYCLVFLNPFKEVDTYTNPEFCLKHRGNQSIRYVTTQFTGSHGESGPVNEYKRTWCKPPNTFGVEVTRHMTRTYDGDGWQVKYFYCTRSGEALWQYRLITDPPECFPAMFGNYGSQIPQYPLSISK